MDLNGKVELGVAKSSSWVRLFLGSAATTSDLGTFCGVKLMEGSFKIEGHAGSCLVFVNWRWLLAVGC